MPLLPAYRPRHAIARPHQRYTRLFLLSHPAIPANLQHQPSVPHLTPILAAATQAACCSVPVPDPDLTSTANPLLPLARPSPLSRPLARLLQNRRLAPRHARTRHTRRGSKTSASSSISASTSSIASSARTTTLSRPRRLRRAELRWISIRPRDRRASRRIRRYRYSRGVKMVR